MQKPVPELDIEPVEENIEEVLSIWRETAWRLGDADLDVLDGDTDAETIGGEPGGLMRGVVVWDANKILCDDDDAWDLTGPGPATILEKKNKSNARLSIPALIRWLMIFSTYHLIDDLLHRNFLHQKYWFALKKV